MNTIRCGCGAMHGPERMEPVGVMEADGERYELANCPSCGSTLCVEVRRFTSSAQWRVVVIRDSSAPRKS
ncbi:MAG: hypothetical protein ACRELB_26905 [Polyangiaceae bacterium]